MLDEIKKRTLLDALGEDSIVLWGAGSYINEVIQLVGQERIKVIFDKNSSKWDSNYNGIFVKNPEKEWNHFVDDSTTIMISVASYNYEISSYIISKWKFPEEKIISFTHLFGEKYMYNTESIFENRSAIEKVYELLEDEESKTYYMNTLKHRICRNPLLLKENMKIVSNYEYVSETLVIKPRKGDVILDCGAYIGDTAERFLKMTEYNCQIYAVEPLKGNYDTLVQWIESNKLKEKVYPIHALIGEKDGEGDIFSAKETSVGASPLNGGTFSNSVEMRKIDNIINDKVDFIKMDIEGAEIAALKGAWHTISKYKPQMVISAYHRTSHMWEIPLLVKKICSEYKIFCGHQMNAAFEPEYYISL